MALLRTEILKHIQQAIQKTLGIIVPPEFSVAPSENPEHGDYATNAALALAKALKKNPMEIANQIAAKLETGSWKAEVAPPGFINFRLKDEALISGLQKILDRSGTWGKSDVGKGKTVVVEYFQLNIAKRPHIGHIRSAIIGDAIKRLFLSQAYHAVSDTHVGDWGTQFGILLWEIKEQNLTLSFFENLSFDQTFTELENLYQAGVHRAENMPGGRERAKAEFAKLEQGDSENRAIWQWVVEVSMTKLATSVLRLGLLPFDEHRGESFYEDRMQAITELALEKGVAKKTDDGAVMVDLRNEGLDEAVLIKSDGASTYLLRDLATIQYRKKQWDFLENLYVVDVRQFHHFEQVFHVAELLGLEGVGQSKHIEFGFMKLPGGPMSTRAGTAISLESVLSEANSRARKVIEEKNPDLENKEQVAEMVGLGALKYFDLSHNRKSDIVFRWDEVLSFEGNTGPYLQYTHARLRSILRKIGQERRSQIKEVEIDLLEHRFIAMLFRFPEVIEDSLAEFFPNILADYLYKLASLVNEFYHSHPVMQEPDRSKKRLRVEMVSAAALTLAKGLQLLGIAAPEEM